MKRISIVLVLLGLFTSCSTHVSPQSSPAEDGKIEANANPESNQQWLLATIHPKTGDLIKGYVQWIPDRKSYEVKSTQDESAIHTWVDENEVEWITLADGSIWKDYRNSIVDPSDETVLPEISPEHLEWDLKPEHMARIYCKPSKSNTNGVPASWQGGSGLVRYEHEKDMFIFMVTNGVAPGLSDPFKVKIWHFPRNGGIN